MKKTHFTVLSASLLLIGSTFYSGSVFAETTNAALPELTPVADAAAPKPEMPAINPIPPSLQAAAYILIDAQSGKIITQQNASRSL